MLNNLAFIAFLGFLATIYIANTHYADRNIRNIQVLNKEVREMRWHYMSLQSENMFNSLRSEVESRVKDEGLRLSRGKLMKVAISD